ncbi:MAG: GNAT family N-acetyltransferase [Bacteroidota bacterium]
MYQFQVKAFQDLSVQEFHDILQLRIAVFVVEQNCPYPELDGKDPLSFHIAGRDSGGKVIAAARVLPPGISYEEVSIGRVSSAPAFRGKGVGHPLMEAALAFIERQFGPVPIRISAQAYLLQFYEKHGFVSTGKEYLEDDIPHIEMVRGVEN